MKKFFSFIAAVLFAGSMMADVEVVYNWADNVGTTALGNGGKTTVSTVKIHENTDEVAAVKFEKSYVLAEGHYMAIYPAEGTFKAGDSISFSAVISNTGARSEKYAMAQFYAEDGATRLFQGDTVVNGRTMADEPIVEGFKLAADQDSLLIGRYGSTNMFITMLKVTREALDVPVVTAISCADVYNMAKNDVVDLLNDVVVTYVNGANVYVKDATASMLIYLPKNTTVDWVAGNVLSGVAGVVDVYNGLYEVKPSADQIAAVTATAGEAPAAEELTAITTADINKYASISNVTVAAGEFVTTSATNLDMVLGGTTYVLRNNFKIAYTFEEGKAYNMLGVVSIYEKNGNATLQFFPVSIEEVGAQGEAINIDIEFAVLYKDMVAAEGWWLFEAENEDYEITISNTSTTQAAGVYTVDDLDAEHTYIYNNATEQMILITEASLTLTEAEDGSRTIEGTVTGNDGNTYVIKLVYKIPTAETTVNVVIPEWEVEDASEIFDIESVLFMGEAADGTYVQFALRGTNVLGHFTDADCLSGTYGIEIDGKYKNVYSMSIDISVGAELNAIVTADILCFDNTLYHVTTAAGQGINNIDAAVKAIKSIVNGQLVIIKNGVRYNVNGAVVK